MKDKLDKYLGESKEEGILMVESEDGVMTYFTGQGNYHQAIRYGKKPQISRRSRLHNLQFSKEILKAEGVLTNEVEEAINSAMSLI